MKPQDMPSDDLSPRLKLLDEELNKLPIDSDAMILSQLEGFLAGIIVCPDMIMPSEWLPLVWGGDEDGEPVFEDAEQAKHLTNLVMEHYNATIKDINAGRYAPVFDADVRHDETLWEIWIEGFEQAMALRPESWRTYLDADEETGMAMAGFVMLIGVAEDESGVEKEVIEDIHATAPDLIPRWVEILNAARTGQYARTMPNMFISARSTKVGRNDQCPCGSGKKYKKCCGLN
jgi:uncharacterized protein